MIAVQTVQQLLIYPRRIAALSSIYTGVQDIPQAFRTWQRLALVLYGALLGLAGG
jgi:hypothetical protein